VAMPPLQLNRSSNNTYCSELYFATRRIALPQMVLSSAANGCKRDARRDRATCAFQFFFPPFAHRLRRVTLFRGGSKRFDAGGHNQFATA
jgi:hypothetical protein